MGDNVEINGWTLTKNIDLGAVLSALASAGVVVGLGAFMYAKLTSRVEAIEVALPVISSGYSAAVSQSNNKHQTDFARLESEIDTARDEMTAQAVSLGRLEVGQEYILRTVTAIAERLE